MKSNDNIPEDEMLLAEAIAAAKAKGLAWCSGRPFKPDPDKYHGPSASDDVVALIDSGEIKACCAMGALALAGRVTVRQAFYDNGGSKPPKRLTDVYTGNDRASELSWGGNPDEDNGESLGWAFRCAMRDDS